MTTLTALMGVVVFGGFLVYLITNFVREYRKR